MTREDIIRMAEQCGIPECEAENILRFASMIVSAERQRIVNLLMGQHERAKCRHNYWQVAAEWVQVGSDT